MEHDDRDPELAPEAREALRAAFRPARAELDELDQRVGRAADDHFGVAPLGAGPFGLDEHAQPQHVGRVWLWRAAAAVLLAGGAWLFVHDLTNTLRAPELAAGPDCDGNGRVDVLDAFGVARSIELGVARAEWDFDGNGRVERADADELARRAVSLGS